MEYITLSKKKKKNTSSNSKLNPNKKKKIIKANQILINKEMNKDLMK